MTKKKNHEELMNEAKAELDALGLDQATSPGAYATMLIAKGLTKFYEQNEALKSPTQKAAEKQVLDLSREKQLQEKALKERQRKIALFSKWCKRDTWLIQSEALFLTMGCDPSQVTLFDRPTQEIAELVESCVGISLSVINPNDSKNKWRVTPSEWVRWVKYKGYPVPPELIDILFPSQPSKPSIAKAQTSREQKKRDRQRFLNTFAFNIEQRAKEKNIAWDNKSIPVTKAEFLDVFYSQYPQIGKISDTTFAHDIAKIGLKFQAGTKCNPNNKLAQIMK